ncbi:hypothetical protein [Streptomyces sp. NPDC053560]|uniref:hypothetical protein n=1 Tax=Streptomyces sp. NPDC053560 TaxID=3365711 RepID=UPI0037CF174C
MPDSPKGAPTVREQDIVIVSIPEIPDRLTAENLPRVSAARVRQLVAADPDFPKPIYVRGRVRLWLWNAVLRYFRQRKLRPGYRTDLEEKRQAEAAQQAEKGGE